jgi:PAS domain S-box-containing protein
MTRVLVVDDKEENVYYLQVLLTAHGCQVLAARHGAEALVLARQAPPDVVISDLLMPVMDGYTLLRHWKADARLKKVPFIVYTATYTEVEDEHLALSLGADAFILKPAEPEDFLARLREVQANAAAGSPVPPNEPRGDEAALLKDYSETLIRKLEEKTLQLEETNRALQQDIADREAVEAQLRKSEEEFRLLTEAMPQIVWMTRPDGWHTHFNQKWIDYTGLTLEESLGDGWKPALHPVDRRRAAERWRQATNSGEVYEIEYRLRRVDGTYHWMLGRALPLRDDAANIIRWFGTCTDIDELKKAEARIGEQASLLDKTQDAILVRSLDHQITYLNRSAERIFGWRADEALGRSAVELFEPDPDGFDVAMNHVLAHGEWTGELHHTTKSGTALMMDCRWTLVRGDAGQPDAILAIETDVTERKLLEHRFLRAQRLESIGTLAGGIAHDLNNALSPIILSIELLKLDAEDRATQELLSTMEGCAKRGADMVSQVLSFARGVEGRRVAVQLDHLIRGVEKIANDTFLKSIDVRSVIPSKLSPVVGDPTQLHQVLLNLCLNARDAMPDGGVLTLLASDVALDAQTVGPDVQARPGPHVLIEVEDTGVGMAQAVIDRIFEPFFTTKEIGKGTGLGLSTSLAIVKSHQGFVQVDSEPGKGTRFRVYLPAQSEEAACPPKGDAGDLPRGHGELILIVDDEVAGRQLTKQTLEAFGYRVLVAADGAEAVAIYSLQKDRIAAVLTDMMMPVMDGPAAIEILLRINPDVRIVATSGLAVDARPARVARAPVKYFLPKPYDSVALLRTLDLVLRESV